MPVVPIGLAPNAPMGSVATWYPRNRDLRDAVRFGVSPIGTKHDFDKLNEDLLADKADYVFSTTIDTMHAIHTSKKAVKLQDRGRYQVNLARENVPVYKRADTDTKSEVFGTTPPGMTSIATDCRVTGLEGDGPYWRKSTMMVKDLWLWGYIHNDDV